MARLVILKPPAEAQSWVDAGWRELSYFGPSVALDVEIPPNLPPAELMAAWDKANAGERRPPELFGPPQ